MATNVQMKIITEDNIDMVTQLTYGNSSIDLSTLIEEEKSEEDEEIKDSEEETSGYNPNELVEIYNNPNPKKSNDVDEDDDDEDDEDDDEQKELPEYLKDEYFPWNYVKLDDDNEPSWYSIIIDNKGYPTDVWAEKEPPVPNVYPSGWNQDDYDKLLVGNNPEQQEREEIEKNIASNIPMQRVGEAKDLAGLITFLASQKADYMTGLAVQVDGGSARTFT